MSNVVPSSHDGGELGLPERTISVAVGLALAATAAKPRPNYVLSILALGAGVYLAYRGATGHCPIKAAMT